MVSPQNDPTIGTTVGAPVTGRGFVTPEEAAVARSTHGLVLLRSHISWGAVIAGSIMTLAFLILSSSLAYAVGVPAYTSGTDVSYGWGAGIWAFVTAAVAFFIGGCAGAYLAPDVDYRYRMLHGVMVWALTLPLLLVLLSWGLSAMSGVIASGVRSTGEASAPSYHAAAGWGTFISMACGLVFAAIGGAMMGGDRRTTT
jgi:hypothetical protein